MDIQHYLSILSDRLTDENIDAKEIEKILKRENALLSGSSEQALQGLMSLERLDIIIASTVARSNRAASEGKKEEAPIPELGSTGPIVSKYAKQDSSVDHEAATIQPAGAKAVEKSSGILDLEATRPIKAEVRESETVTISTSGDEKTNRIALSDGTVTVPIPIRGSAKEDTSNEKISLSSTSTVVISDKQYDEKTKEVQLSPELQKLFSETHTVRISEMDTVSFRAVSEDKDLELPGEYLSVKSPTVDPSCDSEDSTVRIEKAPVTDLPDEEKTIIITRTVSNSYNKKTQDAPSKKDVAVKKDHSDKLVSPSEKASVTKKDLINPHPLRALGVLLILFFPTVLLVGASIFAVFLLGNLLLSLCVLLLSILFFLICIAPFMLSAYSLFFAIVYLCDQAITDALGELGLFLIAGSLPALAILLLKKHYFALIDKIIRRCIQFNKKVFLLVHNLYRYTLKGVGRI